MRKWIHVSFHLYTQSHTVHCNPLRFYLLAERSQDIVEPHKNSIVCHTGSMTIPKSTSTVIGLYQTIEGLGVEGVRVWALHVWYLILAPTWWREPCKIWGLCSTRSNKNRCSISEGKVTQMGPPTDCPVFVIEHSHYPNQLGDWDTDIAFHKCTQFL